MRPTLVRALPFCLVLLFTAVALAAPADLVDEIDGVLEHRRELAAAKVRLMEKAAARDAAKTVNQEMFDVHHYFLDLTLEPGVQLLTGTGTASAEVTGLSLTTLDLHLNPNMTVTAVTAGGVGAGFTRDGEILTVTLDRAYATGETVDVSVSYYGDPSAGGYFGWSSYGGSEMIWTLSEPYGARDWWPCKDLNTDKADSLDVRVTVPDHLLVASNGLIVSDTVADGERTTHWRTNYPIVTYLVSLAVHPYEVFSTWYTPQAGGDPMEIMHYVYPDQLTSAQSAYAPTDEMIDVFAQAYGEYPFVEEKYGHASFVWGGGMEHQTMSSMGGLWHDVISHELAHQWWGDMVTCADFRHIWLNEGFATWSEAYWKEMSTDVATYRTYMDAAAYYGSGTIYVDDPTDFGVIFSSDLSYNKASWVVHMLRGVLGDADFFAGLAHYRALYEMGSATTEQFRDAMEAATGRDLDAFIQQWIYGEYFPVYGYEWSQDGAELTVTVDQEQTNTGLFAMPITLRVTTDLGVEDATFDNALASETYVIPVTGTVESVELDPDDWILCQVRASIQDPTFDQGILLVNGVDWSTYGTEITTAYDDSTFWGEHPVTFWDCFAEPTGGYPANLPAPLGHGAVPAEVIGNYSAVVWVGNNYNGDLPKWQETPILPYLEVGGNVLLLGREMRDHLEGDLTDRMGLSWTVEDASMSGALTATVAAYVDVPVTGTQSWNDGFVVVGGETELLFEGVVGGSTQGMGAIHRLPIGIPDKADTRRGRLAVIGGRPYRYDHDALRTNVEYVLSHEFGEPYDPTTAIDGTVVPSAFDLGANYPNPFNPETVIPFSLAVGGEAELAIYDAAGRRVRTLLSGSLPAGAGRTSWDGRDATGRAVSSGTYFARLTCAGEVRTRTLTLVR